eukprot:9602151-Alexandrium_andersonii.AAC.1
MRLASVYLPSGSTGADLGDLHRLPSWEGPWVVVGGLNVDLGRPRGERLVEVAAALEERARARGL